MIRNVAPQVKSDMSVLVSYSWSATYPRLIIKIEICTEQFRG